ncbi:MAG: RsiV family protein [Desulfovibrio sp.]|nr:RsiV family protein [Desulfovibrio sp.]
MAGVFRWPECSRVFFLSLIFVVVLFFPFSPEAFAGFQHPRDSSYPGFEPDDPKDKRAAVKTISGAKWPGIIDHLLQRPQPDDPEFGKGFNIHISYPSIGDKLVDGDIRHWVSQIASAFESHLDSSQLGDGTNEEIDNQIARYLQDDDLISDLAATDDETKSFELFGNYSVSRPSKSAISVTFELWNYSNNGPGTLDIITLNYNLRNKQRLNFVDIFERPDVALELMSNWTRKNLGPRLEAGGYGHMLETGTMPLVENFSSLTLTPDGIRINFQPYQIAPMEAGAQKIDMPLSELLPSGPLLALWDK